MKIEDIVHVILYIILIIIPYTSSKRFLKKYGIYFALFMCFVILGWLLNNGQCILFYQEKKTKHTDPTYKYGITPAFFVEYFNFNKKYLVHLAIILELLYILSAYKFIAKMRGTRYLETDVSQAYANQR